MIVNYFNTVSFFHRADVREIIWQPENYKYFFADTNHTPVITAPTPRTTRTDKTVWKSEDNRIM